MKKSIIISIVIFLVMSIFIGSVSAASTTVSLRASNANPKIGDTITITVSFSTPVGTASLNLNYNNNVVQYVSSNAMGAVPSGASVKLNYIDTSFQNKTITSMTVTFKVIAEGTANFTVSNAVLSNVNAEELTASISGGATITAKNETNNNQTPITKPETPATNTKPNTNTNTNKNPNKNQTGNTTTNNNNNQVQNNNVNSTTENLPSNESNNENNNQINNVPNVEQNKDNNINEINQSEENKTNYKVYLIIAIIAIVIIIVLAIIICRIKNS